MKTPKDQREWFAVSTEGLQQLTGNSKSIVARELLQDAFDEAIKEVQFLSTWRSGLATITVIDDSPIGFRNLNDVYTLYGPTYKRECPDKRGRFNLGLKEALSHCELAEVTTTTGRIVLDRTGRHKSNVKRTVGSEVKVQFKILNKEYQEMIATLDNYIVPKNLDFYVNGTKMPHREVFKSIEATLPTEILTNEMMTRTSRKTTIDIYKPQEGKSAWLYEIGLPVLEIDCDYSVDVQQKVPLSSDRENVPPSFLRAIYAEIVNACHREITPEMSSNVWVREAVSSDRVIPAATTTVIDKRYGEKRAIFNPRDHNANDDALAHGFRLVYGAEMSKKEWMNVHEAGAIQTTSAIFPQRSTDLSRSIRIKRCARWHCLRGRSLCV